jgi:putative DNA primase/helicase
MTFQVGGQPPKKVICNFDGRPLRSVPEYSLLTLPQLRDLPPYQWRIRNVLPMVGFAAIYGAPGVSKSLLAIDLSYAIAHEDTWFGHRVENCVVTYCALEAESGIGNRFCARLCQADRMKSPQGVRVLLQEFNLLNAGDVEGLANAVLEAGGSNGVIIIDTLNRAAPGVDENDSKGMGSIIAAATDLRRRVGGLIVFIHHSGKDIGKGLRGHSSLLAALDASIEVTKNGTNRQWQVKKSKEGMDGISHLYRLNTVHLGQGERGEDATSCVIEPMAEAAKARRSSAPPPSGNQEVILEAIRELSGNTDTAPDWLCYDEVVVKARPRLMNVEPKRQTERTKEAISGLVARGLVAFEDNMLRLS